MSRLWALLRPVFEEVLVALGLILITVGLWPVIGLMALVVPGVALAWVAFPVRRPFIERPAPKKDQSS